MTDDRIPFDLIVRDSAAETIRRIIEAIRQIPDVKHIQVEDEDR